MTDNQFKFAVGTMLGCIAIGLGVVSYELNAWSSPHVDAENIVVANEVVFYPPTEAATYTEYTMPEMVITAPRPMKSDPLAGPGKRCSEGAWFASRALEQGSGNVRGFCP